ncbi:MAG: hypothetical protein H7066_06430 [Cytophagaceae bacterium]|nr:hypothetical protein [Gemmatimonadaceae bacterium]
MITPRREWRKLAIEGALIVLSVLLGLALSEWREGVQEQKLAHNALVNFRREIAANLARLEKAQPGHAAMAQRLADANTGRGEQTAFDVFVANMPEGGLDTQPLAAVAWETAEGTGALRLLDYETAALLSETYTVQSATLLPTLQRLSDRFLSPGNFDPAQRPQMVRTHRMLLVELSGQETYLMEIYRRALAALPAK